MEFKEKYLSLSTMLYHYTSLAAQVIFKRRILESCRSMKKLSDEDVENIKIVTPLLDNPNAPDEYGRTPIYKAAQNGHTENVKILAPLTDNPNAPNEYGSTPIYWAAWRGHTEIVKILAPLTENPNAPDSNALTPIYWAAIKGHTEIVKILAPLTDNPNAPNNVGETPSAVAKNSKIREILESFNTSRKQKAGPSTKPPKKRARKF